MKATNYVIVELKEAYTNKKKVAGRELIINSTIEDVSSINREATVVSAPEFTILKEGDSIIAHHNIFRKKYDYKGKLCQSDYFIGSNLYFVPLTEIFLWKRGLLGDWEAIDPFVFIEPIELDESKELLVGIKKQHKNKEHKKGVVKYLNSSLKEQGVKVGDKIVFKKNSEYEFNIGGMLLYRMNTKDIIIKI